MAESIISPKKTAVPGARILLAVFTLFVLSCASLEEEFPDTGPPVYVDKNPAFDFPGDASGRFDLSNVVVCGFSQSNLSEKDPQVYDKLVPDLVTRNWSVGWMDRTPVSAFSTEYITQCHAKNILFMGGITSAVFRRDPISQEEFQDWITRDAWNQPVDHTETGVEGCYRGSLANQRYRSHLLDLMKAQIDLGLDGINVDEADANGYTGGDRWHWNGNEGFDNHFIADFNRYLMDKYPAFSKSDWIEKFKMSANNVIKPHVAYNDLRHNFNYRQYLQKNGWANNPRDPANPLAKEWGTTVGARRTPRDECFLDKALRLYWKELVFSIRTYARQKYGREILITANGLYPYVDFNTLGMYNYNVDDDGKEADYVPTTVFGRLNGLKSLKPVFKKILARNRELAGNVPLVLFIDWPSGMMNHYYGFSAEEKKDFWQIYVPEAYACGVFYAFQLKATMRGDPTAEQCGVLDFMVKYAAFYKTNKSLYQETADPGTEVAISIGDVEYSVMEQPSKHRWLIHLINHNYSGKIFPQSSFTVSFPASSDPSSVSCLSPDFPETRKVSYTRSCGRLVLKVESLGYYDVLVVEW